MFNWMPLAAVIEKRVICMHGPWRGALLMPKFTPDNLWRRRNRKIH